MISDLRGRLMPSRPGRRYSRRVVVRSATGGVGHVTRPGATGDAYSARK